MPENGESALQPTVAAPGQEVEVTCQIPTCGKRFFVVLPPVSIMNDLIGSIVLVPHPEPQTCPYCGQCYQYQLVAVGGIQAMWRPVATRTSTRIVRPAPGLKL